MKQKMIFEPHSAFRSDFLGEDWPIGYLSEGVGNPVFALHDVVGDKSVDKLREQGRSLAVQSNFADDAAKVLRDMLVWARRVETDADDLAYLNGEDGDAWVDLTLLKGRIAELLEPRSA